MRKLFTVLTLLMMTFSDVYAETCPNAELIGAKLITNVNWSSVFPMRFAGATIQGSKGWIPDGAYNGGAVCNCPDKYGVPEYGVPSGLWEPVQAIEVQSKEWCSSVAGGIQIGPSKLPIQDSGDTIKPDSKKLSFYEYIQWSFPILKMVEVYTPVRCNNGLDYTDLDVISPSSVLPTHRNEALSFFANPMSVIYANVASMGVGAAECTKLAFSDRPINSWPGSAGCWGNIYPLSGYAIEELSPVTAQSLIATRSLAFSVGTGMERYAVGSKGMCEAQFNPNLIKDRYKMSMFYPKSEAGTHPIGKPSLLWGEWLNKLSGPDAFVNIVNKYGECCLR